MDRFDLPPLPCPWFPLFATPALDVAIAKRGCKLLLCLLYAFPVVPVAMLPFLIAVECTPPAALTRLGPDPPL